jgi:molybdopterin-binding protein
MLNRQLVVVATMMGLFTAIAVIKASEVMVGVD